MAAAKDKTGGVLRSVEGIDTPAMVKEAQLFLKRSQEIGVEAAENEFRAAEKAKLDAAMKEGDERNFQQLLNQSGGNYELLARKLHSLLREQSRAKKREAQTNQAKKPGRNTDEWGIDGSGKVMAMAIIDAEIEKMRAEGIEKPKIQDAIARAYGIPPEKRLRRESRSLIQNYASRYTEAKALIKKEK